MQRRDLISSLMVPMHQILMVKRLELPLKDVSTCNLKEGCQLMCGKGSLSRKLPGFPETGAWHPSRWLLM